MKGFWDDLTDMLDRLQQRGMVRGEWRDYIAVANSLEEISELIKG
jgi:predicted Rossmann-fold nucleotide-binding protein